MPKKLPSKQYADVATGVRLSSHEKLCAERMNNILKTLDEMKKEIKSLRHDVSTGKGAIGVLVFLGTLVAGVIGFFTWDG